MRILVTGGAGFIGCNAAMRLLGQGDEVIVFDDLSRRGADKNLSWLKAQKGGKLTFIKGDIRNEKVVNMMFDKSVSGEIDLVLHLAAQVAVTTSVADPRLDFSVNALGAFNLLEAVRLSGQDPVIINASTNKVYGKLESAGIMGKKTRYAYKNLPQGVSEDALLDFYSPYGCSKGAADQYMVDYGRIYGLKTINLRQSCIYGPRQFGVEDQGWVAHFVISAVLKRPVTIYGDGKQVRDILFVEDLLDAFFMAKENLDRSRGKAYNIGGGADNSVSLLEFVDILQEILGEKIELRFGDWRPGDQKVYISDTGKAHKDFGWEPKIDIKKGIALLVEWVQKNRDLFNDF